MMHRRTLALILAATALTAAARPPRGGSSPAVDAVTACRAIAGDADRLACFDRAAAALDTAVTQRDITVLDRQEVRQTRRTLFGFSLPNLALFGVGDTDDEKAPEFTTLDSTIVSAVPVSYGKYEMTLKDGGAVWRNIDLLDAPPARGSKVHITRGAIGSYFFKIDSDRAIKAMRLR